MYDRPPLLALEYFVATASLGTIRAASKELNITPSAVSHQIGRLEAFLNVQLFHRHKQRLVLTEAGTHYLEQLSGPIDQIRQATRDVTRRDQRRQLRISAPPTFLTFFLLPRLSSFVAAHPDITISFFDSLILDPMKKNIDCAVEYRMQADVQRHSQKLFDDEVIAIANPEYIESMGIKSLADVKRCTLIETEKRMFSWNNVLHEFSWRNRCHMMVVQYTYQAMTSVALGQGLALANRYNAEYLLRRGSLMVPFGLDINKYYGPAYYFSCLEELENTVDIQAFKGWLLEQIQESAKSTNYTLDIT